MILAILIGRKGSVGFPDKNTKHIFGRPLFAYPLKAAAAVKEITKIIVSTDDPSIHAYIQNRTASPYKGTPIQCLDRPSWLCTDDAQAGAVYQYVYHEATVHDTTTTQPEFAVLLMANAPMVTPQLIQQGIAALREDPSLDSAITVSCYNMWNPARARRIDKDGLLQPMVHLDGATCDRNSVGDVWFADFGAVIVRPRCLDKLDGVGPQPWMGQHIYPLKNWGGFDIDYAWQLPQIEYWLHQHGYTELA